MFFTRRKQKQQAMKERAKRLIVQERAEIHHADALRQLASLKQHSGAKA